MTTLPLSVSQKDIWTEILAWPNSCHLNIGGFSRLSGHVDVQTYQQALDNLVAAEDALRLVPQADGSQLLLAEHKYTLIYKDFSDKENGVELADAWQQEWMTLPFDIGKVPPIRFALVSARKDLHYVVIQSLHVCMDGWSLSNTVQKLGQHYTAIVNQDASLVQASRPYQEFIIDSRNYREGSGFEKDHAFWQEFLPELPEGIFEPRYNSSKSAGTARAYTETLDIKRQLMSDLKSLVAEDKCTLFHCFLGLLAIYICRSQRKEEFLLAIPSLNRGGNKFKSSLGMFVGVIPLKIDIKATDSARDVIINISRTLKRCYRHAKYPLSEQFKRLNAIQQGRERIFDVIFSFEEFNFSSQYGDAEVGATNQTFPGFSRYPLGISVCDFLDGDDAHMVLEGNEQFFSQAETQLLGQRLVYIGQQVLKAYQQPISSLDICTDSEKQQLTKKGVSLSQADAQMSSYFQLIEQQAELNGKSTALVWQHGELNFQQLIHCANRLSVILAQKGVERGDIVALALPRGPLVVIAMLAVSKLGAIFLINDSELPLGRLELILQQSNSKLLLHSDNDAERFSSLDIAGLSLSVSSLLEQKETDSQAVAAITSKVDSSLDDIAYVLFTSGTTGVPKGVAVSHRALILRLLWIAKTWNVTATDRSLQSTQINFDPALIELLVPLIQGGSVAFPPAGRLLPEQLPDYMVQFDATMIAFVPSTLTRFMDGIKDPKKLKLRVCCCGGEVLPRDIAKRFTKLTNAQLYNVYGPTEATIFVTSWLIRDERNPSIATPIGAPLADSQVLVLDQDKKLLPFGVIGEIYLGGETLSQGYINAPEKQHKSFVNVNFCKPETLYKTGDLGWLDTSGVLHFVGRNDRQIKLRGYRIELNEIENALYGIPEVTSAAVKVIDKGVKAQIHAWLVINNPTLVDNVRVRLTGLLPDYMLPSRFHVLPQMPYTTNGKIDYDALVPSKTSAIESNARAPIGHLETKMLQIWRKALNQPNLTVLDNFFAVGGDSLSAVSCLNDVESWLNKRLSLHQLVENPTVASFCSCLETSLKLPKLLVSLGDTSRNVSLYICASGNGDMLRFKALARAMSGVCDLHMLQPPGNQTNISIEELARLYSDTILQRKESSVYIAGFSVGGLAALETSKNLQDAGIEVKSLFIVDTILLRMPRVGIWCWRKLTELLTWSGDKGKKLTPKKPYNTLLDRGLYAQVKAMNDYQLSNYDHKLVLIKSSAYLYLQSWLIGGWKRIANKQRFSELQLDTTHSGFFEPGKVEELAKHLSDEIKKQGEN